MNYGASYGKPMRKSAPAPAKRSTGNGANGGKSGGKGGPKRLKPKKG